MAKKKISSQDFLNLMDEQEAGPEKMAFNPAKEIKPKKAAKVKAAKPELFLGRFKLTPMQQEWVKFAEARTPRFVKDIVGSPTAQRLVERVENKLHQIFKP